MFIHVTEAIGCLFKSQRLCGVYSCHTETLGCLFMSRIGSMMSVLSHRGSRVSVHVTHRLHGVCLCHTEAP